MTDFHGRDLHFTDFKDLLQSSQAKLVACQGRRRIGQSTFISQCADETTLFINISGLPYRNELSKDVQLDNFTGAIDNDPR